MTDRPTNQQTDMRVHREVTHSLETYMNFKLKAGIVLNGVEVDVLVLRILHEPLQRVRGLGRRRRITQVRVQGVDDVEFLQKIIL